MSIEWGENWNKCSDCGRGGELEADVVSEHEDVLLEAMENNNEDQTRLLLTLLGITSGWFIRSLQPVNVVCPVCASDADRQRAQEFLDRAAAISEFVTQLLRPSSN
jgi:hypothetical protein